MASYKIIFYVPESHVEQVKEAVFLAGAGQQGYYENCCWQVLGVGQFRPLVGSKPFIGTHDDFEQLAEYRVEVLCDEQYLTAAIHALKAAHPYEEPAVDVILRHFD
ncbi:MAG: hypothetical protein ACJATV_001421 [Granulosicoccus sp.]|jgi:hypothetical protein